MAGAPDANLHEPLVNILDLLVPKHGAVAIGGIIREQLAIVLQVRAAAAGIGDDGVELVGRELVDLLARELLGEFPFAVVGVERTAAELLRRRDDFAAVARQHFHGVAVDVAEDQVLCAAGEHGDAIFLFAQRRA